MLPPEFQRQLIKGNHLELMKQVKLNQQLKEIEATIPSFRKQFFLAAGNRLIAIGESIKVLAEPRYNVPQSQS